MFSLVQSVDTDTIVNVLFTVNYDALEEVESCNIPYLIVDTLEPYPEYDVESQVIQFAYRLPEELLECLTPGDLIEFIGIDEEFLIAIEPDYAMLGYSQSILR